ncbi:bms1 [Ecytonucleospora hepatopenaei]|uniref:Bms1 n=1 Tax=Ecytonucleospora hepatopenaei TaxID=646526 RepID=A0A1W0E7M3_9MICR|nr:bms1 [Ecytonucleospora hepatopenaei]
MEKITKSDFKKAKKMQLYNELHSKVTIENMFYKDAAPAIVLFICKNDNLQKTTDVFFKKYQKEHYYEINGKRFQFLFLNYDEMQKFICLSKIADLVVFDVNTDDDNMKDKLDLAVFEYISIINIHGQLKAFFVSESKNKKIKKAFEKRLKAECGYVVKIFTLLSLKFNLFKFKIRPVEFKCNNSYMLINKVENNVVTGVLRGKPISLSNLEHKNILTDEVYSNVQNIKVMGKSVSFTKENKKEQKNEDVDFIEEMEDNKLEFLQEDDNSDCSSFNDSIENDNINSKVYDSNDDIKSTEINEEDTLKENFQNETKKSSKSLCKDNFLMKNKEKDKKAWETKKEILRKENYTLPGDIVCFKVTKPCVCGDVLVLNDTKIKNHEKVNEGEFNSGDIVINKYYLNNLKELIKIYSERILYLNVGWEIYKISALNSKLSKNDVICEKMSKNGLSFNFCPLTSESFTGKKFFVFSTEDVFFRILFSGKFTDKRTLYKTYNLMGYPDKVNVNTVYVKGMFGSKKECSKFLFANLKTASGIRGILKSPIGAGGDFRATFEGNILESDVVLLQVKEKYIHINKKENMMDNFLQCISEEREKEVFENSEENEDAQMKSKYLQKLQRQSFVKKEKDSCDRLEELINSESTSFEEISSSFSYKTHKEHKNYKDNIKLNEEKRKINALKHIKQKKIKQRNKGKRR